MKAVLCNSFTGPADLRLGEIATPRPAGDEILIDVHAASVSFMDQLLVSGLYQMRPPTPFVPGTEASASSSRSATRSRRSPPAIASRAVPGPVATPNG